MDRASADYMGMLATVMNALAMQNALEQQRRRRPACSRRSRWPRSASPTSAAAPMRHLEKGRVVIFAAGTGNPFFTTDTAAALRAAEMGCDALLKGTRSMASIPPTRARCPTRERYERLTYLEVLAQDLKVMDAAAISLARENGMPIVVFSIHAPGAFAAVMRGEGRFTTSSKSRTTGGVREAHRPCRPISKAQAGTDRAAWTARWRR